MPWRPLTALSLIALALTLALALGALEGIPHVSDEQAYLLQARIFAAGEVVAPTPVDGVAILNVYQRLQPGWHGVFPPGWPMVLALGAALGLPWIVNPLLTAALPWAAWWALSPRMPQRAALFAAGLFALSPGVLVLGASMMSHPLTLLCGLLVCGAALRPELGPRSAAAGGAALGLMMLARPFDGAVVGLPLCAVMLWRARTTGLAPLAAFALGPLVALALTAAFNDALTGSWSSFPVQDWYARPTDWGTVYPPGCNRLGFGADRGCFGPRGYHLGDALAQAASSAVLYDRLLIGFMGGGLLAVVGLPMLLRVHPMWALPALTVPLGYAAYWYHGVVFGPRFWSSVNLAALPAAALTLDALARWLEGRGQRAALAWALPALGLLASLPPLTTELSDDYWCADADRRAAVKAAGVREGVVLVKDRGQRAARWPLTTLPDARRCAPDLSQGVALGWNDPLGRAPLTWIEASEDLTGSVEAAARRHPDAPVHLLVRDLETGVMRLGRWDRQAGAFEEVPLGP